MLIRCCYGCKQNTSFVSHATCTYNACPHAASIFLCIIENLREPGVEAICARIICLEANISSKTNGVFKCRTRFW